MTASGHDGAAPGTARGNGRVMDGGAAARLFAGPGEMRARCREMDWAATPLGPVEAWPASLRTVAGLVLAAPTAMVVLWGPELVQIYNDRHREVMGDKHPAGLGQPTRACWPEVWAFNAPLYEGVVQRGEAFTFTDQPLVIQRHGRPEEAFFTLGFSPVPDDGGGAGGVLVTVAETTAQVRARDAREQEREAERERLLAESEAARARATAILESIGDAFYAVDADFRFTYVNRKAEELWGRPRESLLGRHYWSEFPQAVGSVAHQHHLRVMREHRPAHFEAVSPILDQWLDVSLYPDGSGGRACYFRDISGRKQAEAEGQRLLQEAQAARDAAEGSAAQAAASEARYRTLFDSMDQGFCVMQVIFDADERPVDYRFLEANPTFEQQTGLVDAVGRTAREVVPELEEHWFQIYGRVAATGEPVRFQNGSEPMGRWFDVYAFRVGAPQERRVALLFTDVSAAHAAEMERERLLAELGAERERLRTLILQMPAPLALLTGPEHRFELVNDAFRRVSGGGRDITGMTPYEAFPELEGQAFFALHDRVFQTGEGWAGPETPVRYDRDGTGVQDTWFNMRLEPVRGADGRVAAILNYAVDVTDQVRARQEIMRLLEDSERARAEAEAARREAERARAEAEEANRAKSQFLAVMSHELRTPLNAIGGYAELLEMGIRGPVTQAQRSDLQRIQTSQRHLLGLINEVLNYARIETGTVHYDLADVPVREVLGVAESLVAPQARAKGLALVLSECPPELAARADPEKLRQIIVNLLSNAVKFTAPGGRVEVRCAREDAWVAVRVRDTGIGIPADKLDAIFDPFVQVRADLTRTAEGTGLGLAISRDLARGLGGDLDVESVPGAGSTFVLTLPAA